MIRLSCTRGNLYTGLSITSHLPVKNVNLPILNNVLILAKNGTIRFTSTNLELAVSCQIRGKVEEEGECTLPSKLLFDYVSLLPNERVDFLEEDNHVLRIECGTFKTKIKGLPATEFPLIPPVTAETAYRIKGEVFRRALSQVLFAAASNEARPELSGIFLHFRSGKNGEKEAVFAATDSYRLAEARVEVVLDGGPEETSVIVPARALAEVNRILSVFKDDVESPSDLVIRLSEQQAVFSYGTVELISRTIDGKYPDYRQIIPQAFQTEVVVDRDDLLKAVKTASLFSRAGLFDVTVRFDPEGTASVTAVDASRGENTTSCPAKVSGPVQSISLNYRYLLDGLQAVETEAVRFRMIDGSNPCMIEPEGSATPYQYLIMPIRV